MSFVSLTRDDFDKCLRPKGFRTDWVRSELIYTLNHKKDPSYRVIVYTSIKFGSNVTDAIGRDAIRSCAVRTIGNQTIGIASTTRVNRTGSVQKVLARTLTRLREAYDTCNRVIQQNIACKRSNERHGIHLTDIYHVVL